MPPHIKNNIFFADTEDPVDSIVVSLSGGEESDPVQYDIWNDKAAAFLDTSTSQDQILKILTSSIIGYVDDVAQYGPYESDGVPLLNERWPRVRILGTLTADGFTTDGAGSTQAVGTNSEFSLPDLEPQTGVRIELYFAAPFGQAADNTHIKLSVVGNQASSPLSKYVAVASGSGVVPADRIAGFCGLLRGSVITADDSDTVTVSRGLMAYDGAETAFLNGDLTFTLADGDAVDLGSGESYNVTVSRTSAAALVATRGLKAEAIAFPAVPSGNVLSGYLTVESADGLAVTVSQSSVDQSDVAYGEFMVRDGGGLSVIVAPGQGITETDFRQPSSHETIVTVDASVTSRIWLLSAGAKTATTTDAPPEFGAELLALVTTDTDSVTGIVDARRLVHRALVMDHIELVFRGVLTDVTPDATLALAYAYDYFEIEMTELNLSDSDAGWTGGAIKANVLTLAPGAPAPWPSGAAGGTTIYTGHAMDDRRPSIAFDATNLRAVSEDHEVRRIVKGTRILMALASTVTGPGGEDEQEVRVTLHVRRYR